MSIWRHLDLIAITKNLALRLPNQLPISCTLLCVSRCFPISCSDFLASLVCPALEIRWIHKCLTLLLDTIHLIGPLLLQSLALFRVLGKLVKRCQAARLRHREHPDVELIVKLTAYLVASFALLRRRVVIPLVQMLLNLLKYLLISILE